MGTSYDLRELGADALVQGLRRLLVQDHQVTAELLAHLGEVDARKLYRDHACSSTFTYCVERLHMSEPTAYKRIEASRTARRFPLVFAMVADGSLHLTGIALLGPHLTEANHRQLLEAAAHRSKREIEQLLATRFPRPDVPPQIRRLPERGGMAPSLLPLAPAPGGPSPLPINAATCTAAGPAANTEPRSAVGAKHGEAAAGCASAPTPADAPTADPPTPAVPAFTLAPPPPAVARPEIKPLSSQRFSIKLTVSRSVHDKLMEAQALLRHRQPNGEMEVVLERALDALLGQLRRERYGETAAPRQAKAREPKPGSRYVPNEIKRIVAARDGYQCSFVDAEGHRCQERGFLEFDHVAPVAKGGKAEDPVESRLLCRSHNAHAAEREFGAAWMKRKIAAAVAARESQRRERRAQASHDEGRLEPVRNSDPVLGEGEGVVGADGRAGVPGAADRGGRADHRRELTGAGFARRCGP